MKVLWSVEYFGEMFLIGNIYLLEFVCFLILLVMCDYLEIFDRIFNFLFKGVIKILKLVFIVCVRV